MVKKKYDTECYIADQSPGLSVLELNGQVLLQPVMITKLSRSASSAETTIEQWWSRTWCRRGTSSHTYVIGYVIRDVIREVACGRYLPLSGTTSGLLTYPGTVVHSRQHRLPPSGTFSLGCVS